MTLVTIEIQDSVHRWLVSEAAARQESVTDLIVGFITEKSGGAPLDANEARVLRLLQNVSNKAGWVVPSRVLWTNWQVRGTMTELSRALEGLARKELIVANQAFNEFRLTEAGFAMADQNL